MRYSDIALIERQDIDGLTKPEVMDLFDMLSGTEAMPLEISGNSSVAMGFITTYAANKLNYQYGDGSALASYLSLILNDMNNESADGFYEFEGLSIWMSRNIEKEEEV